MRWNSLALFMLCCYGCFAQVNTAFLDHLSRQHLYLEHRAYLNTLPKQNDSTAYAETNFYLTYFNDSLFLKHYSACAGLCAADSSLVTTADKLFLQSSHTKMRDRWFNTFHNAENNTSDRFFRLMYNASENPNRYNKDAFAQELQSSFIKYKRIYNKKPFLGAALSAVVPGLGKLYAGKPKSALLAFLLNAGYAAQTLESKKKLGISHPFTIVNAALFTVFYLSNIYGGYADIIHLKKERKKQFIHDAANFYN